MEGITAELRRVIKEQDHKYVEEHPELADLFANYLTALSETKPEDLEAFTEAYFSTLNQTIDQSDLVPLMIVGPSGCGKVAGSHSGHFPPEAEEAVPKQVRIFCVVHHETAARRREEWSQLLFRDERGVRGCSLALR